VVGGGSVVAFLGILAAFGLRGDAQPASSTVRTGGDGSATGSDPGFVRPNLGQGAFGNRWGSYSATPGSTAGSAHTRSHGS
jgi:hypothetical protein